MKFRFGKFTAPMTLLAIAASSSFADDAAKLTFAKDVAPILFENCVSCHRPGEVAPMSLMSYDEVRPWTKSIQKAVVSDKSMPPWFANPEHGKFKNELRLTDAEIATIDKWIRQGAARGNDADMPNPPQFSEGWQLGEPDMVFELPEQSISADGPDQFANLFTDVALPEDKWVTAVEIRPSSRPVVHHVILMVIDPDQPRSAVGGLQGWLGGWAAGTPPMVFPEGTGRLLKKGSKIMANMHYHPVGEAMNDKTTVGLHFADKPVEKEIVNLWIQNSRFNIPAGDPNHEVRATHVFQEDSKIITVSPHMHYRGKDMMMKAVFPDGREQVLIDVPNYDFNWQLIYELAEPLSMPAGSKIEVIAHFDNSADNPANPDPNKDIRFGLQSTDEMMIGFVDYVVEKQAAKADSSGQ